MKVRELNEFTKGWFVCNFEPSLLKTEDVECAVKLYAAGDGERPHYHAIATEITVVVSGEVMMNDVPSSAGSIIVLEPNEASDFRAVTDAVTAVVKIPSVTGDKYIGRP
jgi:quercetin dioxygenase-like cupin family protein